MKQAKKRKTVLVTGALGHIGSRLIREFSPELVERVVIVDNFLTQRYASLFDLPSSMRYEFHEDDVRTADIAKYLQGADAVVHLAAIVDAPSSKDKPEETFDVNLNGAKRVADACLAAKVPILFPSTTSVYGSQAERVDETCAELKPQSPYADAKLQAEEYIRGLGPKGLRSIIVRFGTIFGYSIGMRFQTAVNKFTWQAVSGTPLTVWKTAWKQKRPYLDLGDCVRSINFILERELFDGETYNILTTNATVEGIVGTIKQFVPAIAVKYVDSAIMNQLSYEVSDTKFRALGFTPEGNLAQGVQETIDKLGGIRAS